MRHAAPLFAASLLLLAACGDGSSTATTASGGSGGSSGSSGSSGSTAASGAAGTGGTGGSTSTAGAGGTGGSSACSTASDCPSGLCEGGTCKPNLLQAFAWPGSKYDQRIAELGDGTFQSAGGFPNLDTAGHGFTASHVGADGATVLAQVDRGAMFSLQHAHIAAVVPVGSDSIVLDVNEGDELDLGGGVVIPKDVSGYRLLVIRLDPSGVAKWATIVKGVDGSDAYQFVADAAVDGAGYVWLSALPSKQTFTVNGVTLNVVPYVTAMLKLDPATGQLLGSRSTATAGGCSHASLLDDGGGKPPPRSMIVGTDNGVIVSGEAFDQCDFGGGPIPSNPVAYGWGFVARYDGNLDHVWSRAFPGGTAPTYVYGMQGPAIALTGTAVYVAGETSKPLDLGNGMLNGNVAVARLDLATGSTVWSKAFSGTAVHQTRVFAAAASPGGVALAGLTISGEDFGTPDLGPGSGAFLLKLDDTGKARWLRTFSGVTDIRNLQATGQEGVALVGYGSQVDYGSGVLAASESSLSVALFQLP